MIELGAVAFYASTIGGRSHWRRSSLAVNSNAPSRDPVENAAKPNAALAEKLDRAHRGGDRAVRAGWVD